MFSQRVERRVHGENRVEVAFALHQPQANVELVGAHGQDRVLEFARERERIPVRALSFDRRCVLRLIAARALDDEGRGARVAVDRDCDMAIAEHVGFDRPLDRGERYALRRCRPVARGGERERAFFHLGRELRRLGDRVDEAPGDGPFAAHALARRAEDVGEVVANVTLVGEPGQAPGAGQDAEQGHLGQTDRARAVVDEDDLVAGKRQLIAAARARAIDGGEELQALVPGRILEAVAGFVGELAEIDLPGVAGQAEHEDVGARAEHPLAGAHDDHRAHLRMLEAYAVDGVVEARYRRQGRSC